MRNALLLLFTWLTELWYYVYEVLWWVAYYAEDIPFVGTDLHTWFMETAELFFYPDPDSWTGAFVGSIYHQTWELWAWLDNLLDTISTFLTWDAIKSAILTWLPSLEVLHTWFSDVTTNITWVIQSWWSVVSLTVQGWIDTATTGLQDLITAWTNFWTITWPQFTQQFGALLADWQDFITVTLPGLISAIDLESWWQSRLLDIQGLIDTATSGIMAAVQPLVDLKAAIVEFFTDPEDWLYKSVDRIIERFW